MHFQSASNLQEPISRCNVAADIKTLLNRKRIKKPVCEQFLPDFYAEHFTLAMNKDRRRQVGRLNLYDVLDSYVPYAYTLHVSLYGCALCCVLRAQALNKLLRLVMQDLEKERRGKNGVENLARAFKQSPNFASDDSQQNVSEKLHHVSTYHV